MVKVPNAFREVVVEFGNPAAKAPAQMFNKRQYVNCWNNWWLVQRLYGQWRHVHAEATGREPAKTWFYPWGDQSPFDWRATVMHVMNAEYSGNASYEWFDWEDDSEGKPQLRLVAQFDWITSTEDDRLDNPVLEFLFAHPEKPLCRAIKEAKKTLPRPLRKKELKNMLS